MFPFEHCRKKASNESTPFAASSSKDKFPNHSILDMDLPLTKLKDNLESIIEHHRIFTWAKSKVECKWYEDDLQRSWVSPSLGTY